MRRWKVDQVRAYGPGAQRGLAARMPVIKKRDERVIVGSARDGKAARIVEKNLAFADSRIWSRRRIEGMKADGARGAWRGRQLDDHQIRTTSDRDREGRCRYRVCAGLEDRANKKGLRPEVRIESRIRIPEVAIGVR